MRHKLYYSPGACSLASHIALEEAGADFEAVRVDLTQPRAPEFLAVNPQGKVPAILVGDRVVTEGPAILGYVARAHPDAGLLPADEVGAAQAAGLVAWCSSTVHVAFARVFRAERIAPAPHDAAVRDAAMAALPAMFGELEAIFARGQWALGDRYSIADGYPFVFWRWARHIELDLGSYRHWQQHTRRMLDRPAVQRAVEREGLHAADWIEARAG